MRIVVVYEIIANETIICISLAITIFSGCNYCKKAKEKISLVGNGVFFFKMEEQIRENLGNYIIYI